MSALRNFASDAAAAIYDAVNASDDLDEHARVMWRRFGEGAISEEDATFLGSYIERRRHPTRRAVEAPPDASKPGIAGETVRRVCSRFAPRQRPRSPDRKASRERRRMLGGSSALPDNLRPHYTEGQRSVLCIVAGEVKRHGICDFAVDKIAALAGVCRTTVQTTLHWAKSLGHIKVTERPRPGRKHQTNVVEVIASDWIAWIKRAPAAASRIGSNLVNLMSTTKIKVDDAVRTGTNAFVATSSGQPSKEAVELAAELSAIAGYQRGTEPRSWHEANPPHVVQGVLNRLTHLLPWQSPLKTFKQLAIEVARRRDKCGDHAQSPRYFSKALNRMMDEWEHSWARPIHGIAAK